MAVLLRDRFWGRCSLVSSLLMIWSDGRACTLSRFRPALREGVDRPEGRAVTQRDWDRLEECISRSLTKLSKDRWEVLHMLEMNWLKSSFVERDLWYWWTLGTSWQLCQTRSASSHVILASCNQHVYGSNSSLSLALVRLFLEYCFCCPAQETDTWFWMQQCH